MGMGTLAILGGAQPVIPPNIYVYKHYSLGSPDKGTLARGNILFNWASDLGKALWLTYVVWWLYLWLKLEGSGLQISALFVFCYHTIYIASKTN